MWVCSQFGPPILDIFSWVAVAHPVAPQQWGEQEEGGQPTAGAPVPGQRLSAGLPLCVIYPAPVCITVINDYKNNEYLNLTLN